MIPANKFLSLAPGQITPEMEEEFFTSLRLRNGTYKTTYQNRFVDVNHALGELTGAGVVAVDSVLDIGISSGTATIELHRDLRAAGHPNRILGTDLTVEACLVRVFPGCFALVEDNGYPLRYDIFRWSMKPWVTENDYRNGFFVIRKCLNVSLGHYARRRLERPSRVGLHAVQLVTPALQHHANISVQADDITKFNHLFQERFTFVRAANVLNTGYFDNDALKSAIGNIRRYLAKPKAALLVVRTHQDGTNHGSLFTIDVDTGCKVVQRIGDGSEVEAVVLECMTDR